MNEGIQVTEGIYWVGTNDTDTTLFENIWPLPRGVSYNSYLILDEKTVLVDAVKRGFMEDLTEKLLPLLKDGRQVDYLVVNHMEPDHSGSIRMLKRLFPGLRIIGNAKTAGFLQEFYGLGGDVDVIEDGGTVNLGKRTLQFYLTPMVHWPETMVTYEADSGTLFSGDAFGGFGVLPGGIFDDEVDVEFFEEETLRYFTNIVGKYAPMVQRAIAKLEGLDIRVVAPTHGPVWRRDPQRIIDHYSRWAGQQTEKGVVIVYASMYGNTQAMVREVSRTLAERGVEKVRMHNVSRTHASFILNDLWRFNTFLFASPTYNTRLFPLMHNCLGLLDNLRLVNRTAGVVGTYGWSGGGVKELLAFCERAKFRLLEPVVEAKCGPNDEDLANCRLLGERLAEAAGLA